jgi:RNA polymerase sigma-70 factor (ECF subfamily)
LQRASNIQGLLNKLPEDQREVIVMRHFANLSFKEIAEKTNCSINTALGRMRYALINLRRLMAEVPAAVA